MTECSHRLAEAGARSKFTKHFRRIETGLIGTHPATNKSVNYRGTPLWTQYGETTESVSAATEIFGAVLHGALYLLVASGMLAAFYVVAS